MPGTGKKVKAQQKDLEMQKTDCQTDEETVK